MKKQEFIDKLKEIGTCEDDVQRRTLLTELEADASKDYDSLETLGTENENLKNDNETLRKANMDLFLHVGQSKSKEDKKKEETGIDDNDTKKKRSFSDLFDENGGIK